ncbi:secreted protein [Legionella beliardensis]|uniref:Secreted protein n=1 Tax=Legionella beliardensis TaxID=91822 RepID=A0A378JQW6_9GAMM|nr:DUF885 domain-containing protein [Legionella beliardensis]STX55590.1 secreted protein [Legionella beliardensis]
MTLFSTLIKEYEANYFRHFPEQALLNYRADAVLDSFCDFSLTGILQWEQEEERVLLALNQIDVNQLNNEEQVTYSLLKENLAAKKDSRICKTYLWDVNPLDGWHVLMTDVAELQPVETEDHQTNALNRWRNFSEVVKTQIANLQEGVRQGFTAPKPAVKRVINQVKLIITEEIEKSPFYSMADRSNNEAFKRKIKGLIYLVINPALQQFNNFLRNEYLPIARTEIGISALPPGEKAYQVKVKQEATLDISFQQIHELGLNYMEKLEKEAKDIGSRIGKYGTMFEIFQAVINDPKNTFSTEQEILDYNLSALNRVKEKVSAWFDMMPKSEGVIRPYPLYKAQTGAPGEYRPPSKDGKEPGVFYINTYEPNKINRIDQESTLFHELIPGHHFQMALQVEDKRMPELNQYLWNSGYGEGWALYVERLADEMGLFIDDISRLGLLANEALRAARLVVDTGIHVMHWTREVAILYIKQHTTLSDVLIGAEVDRYIMLPGQATSYMLGKFEIEKLRDLAKEQLKEAFNIREFHNQVLKNGVVTLPMLKDQIECWITEEKKHLTQQSKEPPTNQNKTNHIDNRYLFLANTNPIIKENCEDKLYTTSPLIS